MLAVPPVGASRSREPSHAQEEPRPAKVASPAGESVGPAVDPRRDCLDAVAVRERVVPTGFPGAGSDETEEYRPTGSCGHGWEPGRLDAWPYNWVSGCGWGESVGVCERGRASTRSAAWVAARLGGPAPRGPSACAMARGRAESRAVRGVRGRHTWYRSGLRQIRACWILCVVSGVRPARISPSPFAARGRRRQGHRWTNA